MQIFFHKIDAEEFREGSHAFTHMAMKRLALGEFFVTSEIDEAHMAKRDVPPYMRRILQFDADAAAGVNKTSATEMAHCYSCAHKAQQV